MQQFQKTPTGLTMQVSTLIINFARNNNLCKTGHQTCLQSHLSLKGLAYSIACTYIAALSYHCKLQRFHDPTSVFLVIKLLQGLKRARHTADSRLPITKSILTKIFQVLPCICRNDFESSLFAAAFSLAFHGLLRVGELVIHPNSSSRVLQSSDVNVDRAQGAINITITYSKTDQMGRGTVLNISRVGDQTCPLDKIVAFKVRPNITGPFFCHFDSSPLTRYQFTAILSNAVKMLKLSNKYTSQ